MPQLRAWKSGQASPLPRAAAPAHGRQTLPAWIRDGHRHVPEMPWDSSTLSQAPCAHTRPLKCAEGSSGGWMGVREKQAWWGEELEPQTHPRKSRRQREAGPLELRGQAPNTCSIFPSGCPDEQKCKNKMIKNSRWQLQSIKLQAHP